MSAETFFARKDAIFALGIPLQSKAVLSRLHDRTGRNGTAWPSQQTLAAELTIGDRHLRTILKSLEDGGYLSVERHQRAVSEYRLNWDAILDRNSSSGTTVPVKTHLDRNHSSATPEPQFRSDRNHSSDRKKRESKEKVNSKGSGLKTDKSKGGLWSIDPGEFKSLDRGDACFDRLVKSGTLRPEDELRFLTLWRWVGLNRDQGPVAALRACIRDREWNGTLEIEDEARAWLKSKRPATDVGSLPGFQHLVESTAVEELEDY